MNYDFQRLKPLILQIIAGVTFSFGDLVANSYAASKYGFSLLWTKLLASLTIIVILQISAQLGFITGRGFLENIRAKYGSVSSILCSSSIMIVNTATVAAEVAAASMLLEFLTGISSKFFAPLVAFSLCVTAVFSSSEKLRLILSSVSFLVILVIPVAASCNPGIGEFLRGFATISPDTSRDWIVTVLALIGCVLGGSTILFEFHEVSEDKDSTGMANLTVKYNGFVVGALQSFVLSISIMIICATQLYPRGEVVGSVGDIVSILFPKLGWIGTILFSLGVLVSFYLSCSVVVTSSFIVLEELVSDVAEVARIRYAVLSGWKVILASASILLGAFLIVFNVNVIKLSLYASAISTIALPIPLFFMAKLFGDVSLPIKFNHRFLRAVCWLLVIMLSTFSLGGIVLSII